MSKVRLTAGRIKQLECPSDKKQAFLWDDSAPGLAVRVTPSGSKSFIFQGRAGGKELRITIGSVITWALDAAQIEARRLQSLCDQGIDPRHERADRISAGEVRRREETRKNVTVGDVWSRYIESNRATWGEHHINDHKRLADPGGRDHKYDTNLQTKAGPIAALMDVRLVDMTPDKLAEWVQSESADRPTRVALAFRLVRAFMNWTMEEPDLAGLITKDAHRAKKVRTSVPKQSPKTDCLQREQLQAWFQAVQGLSYHTGSVLLQVILLTGARHEEISTMEWKDIDFRWNALTLKDKVEGDRVIPLTPYVAHLLRQLPQIPGNDYVFASQRSDCGYVADPRTTHNIALNSAGLPPLSIHGLRRSFGTLAEWVEVPAGIIAQIMGHKPSATAEKHYRQRPLDLLRQWQVKIEGWILEQAGISLPETPE